MTDNIDNLVLEHLRALRTDMSDIKQRLSGLELQMAAMGQQLAGLTTAVYGGKSDMEAFRHRLEHIERRLDLRETA